MNTEDSVKNLTIGTGIIFIGSFLSKLFSYIFRIIAARSGMADYGLLTLGVSLTVFISVFITIGLDHGVLRYVSYFKEKNDYSKVKMVIYTSMKITFILAFLVSVLLFIFSDFICAQFFPNLNQEKLSAIIRIVSITIPFVTISRMFYASFRAFQIPKYEVYTKNIAEPFSKVILAFIFVSIGFGILAISLAYTISIVISMLIGYLLLQTILRKYKVSIDKKGIFKDILRYSFPLVFVSLFFTLTLSLDTFMIGHYKTETDVGIYNAASPTAQLMFTAPSSILALFLPILMALYIGNKREEFIDLYKTVTKWIFIINLVLVTLFIIYSKEVLSIFFGAEYASGYLALIILLVGFFISLIFHPAQNVLLIFKKSKLIFYNSIIALLINGVLNFLLIPKYGIIGAAISTSFVLVLWGLLNFIQSYICLKATPFKGSYLKVLFITLIISVLFFNIKKYVMISNIYLLVIFSILFLFSVFILLLITSSFDKNDIYILSLIKKKLKKG
ncbi:MAG TPA: flippase [Candidatus Nanoarchaeia archaeon]|nr:flippase [Candidatus Nanoarchaeia archaeon]